MQIAVKISMYAKLMSIVMLLFCPMSHCKSLNFKYRRVYESLVSYISDFFA